MQGLSARSDLAHLPRRKAWELERLVEVIFTYFEEATARHATRWKKKGHIRKIILYGSHARGDQVFEPDKGRGYRSDFDILIIVNDKRLTDEALFWSALRAHLDDEFAGQSGRTPVNFIVHSLQDVNNNLAQGRFFFMDIAREGIILYEDSDKPLRAPVPRTPESALAMAREYFEEWYSDAGEFYDTFKLSLEKERHKNAAFQLHQCVEQLYHTVLLTCTFYTPHVHNIGYLRGEAAKVDRRFVYVWPADNRKQVAMFNKLKDAYVKARYAKHYRISTDELEWLGEQAQELSRVVQLVCSERIAHLASLVTTPTDKAVKHA